MSAFRCALALLAALVLSDAVAEQGGVSSGTGLGGASLGESAYLQSHADDAVRWQVLTRERLETARKENRPLFISSGYSACYWCYRMQEDSFRQPGVAARLNRDFLPLLIDRELDPALDAWLLAFVEDLSGVAGWPLNVILTPEGDPVIGVTYMDGPAFERWLGGFAAKWKTDAASLRQSANSVAQQRAQRDADIPLMNLDVAAALQNFIDQAAAAADQSNGGFGAANKFPHVPQLTTLLRLQALRPEPQLREFVLLSLQQMAQQGLRDQLHGGFFRYTEDARWRRPHYEKMLYSQAMLARLYIEAAVLLDQPGLLEVGLDTLNYAVRELKRDDGYFAASRAATSDSGQGGEFYLWSAAELQKQLGGAPWQTQLENLLGAEATKILPAFKNALPGERVAALRQARRSLLPPRDDKVVPGWNGLMLSALSYAAAFSEKLAAEADALGVRLLPTGEALMPALPGAAAQPQAGEQVLLAAGLADWGSARQRPEALQAATALLKQVHKDAFTAAGWLPAAAHPLLPQTRQRMLRDTELPSLSASWLEAAQRVQSLAPDTVLQSMMQQVNESLSDDLMQNSFFHATYLAVQLQGPGALAQEGQK